MEGAGITRIDALLGNSPAVHIVYNFEYVWEDAIGFDHVPFRVTTSHKSFTQCMTILRTPTAINTAMIVDQKITAEVEHIFLKTSGSFMNTTSIHVFVTTMSMGLTNHGAKPLNTSVSPNLYPNAAETHY